MDAFCKSLFVSDKDAEQLAGEQLLSAPAFFDRMLLCLFDALWRKQSEDWSNRDVADMYSDEPYEVLDTFGMMRKLVTLVYWKACMMARQRLHSGRSTG